MYYQVFPKTHWIVKTESEAVQLSHCGPGGRPMYRTLSIIAVFSALLSGCAPYATDSYVRTEVYSAPGPVYVERPYGYPYGYAGGYYISPAPRYYVPPPRYYPLPPPPAWRPGPPPRPGPGWQGGPPPQWRHDRGPGWQGPGWQGRGPGGPGWGPRGGYGGRGGWDRR